MPDRGRTAKTKRKAAAEPAEGRKLRPSRNVLGRLEEDKGENQPLIEFQTNYIKRVGSIE